HHNRSSLSRLGGHLPDEYALFLDSIVGKLQSEQHAHGAAFYSISQQALSEFLIPRLPIERQKEITDPVEQSRTARQKSKTLLERAKRAVEIAIEEDEATALSYLKGSPAN
ncbi:MAG: hypothetical protein ACLFU4_02600, partial [Opitutales bacterium]